MQRRLRLTRQMANLFSSLQSNNHAQDTQINGQEYATQTLLSITDNLEIDKHRPDVLRSSANTSQITSWNQNNLRTLDYGVSQQPMKPTRLRIRERKQLSRDNTYLQNKSLFGQLDLSVKVEPQRPLMPLRQKTENSQHFITLQAEKERTKSKRQVILEIINWKQQIGPAMASTIKKSTVGWKQLGFVKDNCHTRQYQSIRKKQFHPWHRDNQKENRTDPVTRQVIGSDLRPAFGLANLKGRSLKKMFTE